MTPTTSLETKKVENATPNIAAASKVRVTKTIKLKGKAEDVKGTEEILEVHKFVTEPAVATVTIPLKLSMDYQSLGIEIGVSIPCYKEELEEGVEKAYQMVLERVITKVPEIQKALIEFTTNGKARR